MIKSFILNGQEYSGNFNGNRELSQSVTGLDDEVLKNWPRHHVCKNGIAVIEIDGGVQMRLGFHFSTAEEKQIYKDYKAGLNTGSGSSTPRISASAKDLDKYAREVLANKEIVKKLSPEALAFFKASLLEDPKIVSAVKALVNAGMTEEAARSVLKAQGIIKD